MYFFTGSNLFGQWYDCIKKIIDTFTTFSEAQQNDYGFDVKLATLVHMGWSHNIFQYDNKFYITGDYRGSGQRLELINPPKECSNCSNLTVISDDYRLVVVDKHTCTIWSINLENKDVKTIKLTTELPIEHEPKHLKKEDCISKCLTALDTLMFLTSEGLVYSGILPGLTDTRHCFGKPVDIQCGYEHYMLLTDEGRLYTWGNGRFQLGLGDVNELEIPTEVKALAGIKIVKIGAGGWHSLALSEFGDLYAWGWNDSGQLGIKEMADNGLQSYGLPTLVDLYHEDGSVVDVNIKDVACGSKHSAILLEDNTVWTSGHNLYGQLGFSLENTATLYHFKKSHSFTSASRLMCGQWSTVVVQE